MSRTAENRQRRAASRRRGIVLVATIWITVVLMVAAVGLGYVFSLSASAGLNEEEKTRAYFAALSGIERMAAEMDQPTELVTAPGGDWEMRDSTQDPSQTPEQDLFGYRILVEDNCAKMNLNEAEQEDLERMTDLPEGLAEAIIQYRDEGGDAAQKQRQIDNTGSAERYFDGIDDLLLISSVTPDMLFGTTDWMERLSPAEQFRLDWAQISAGTPRDQLSRAQSLADRFSVGSRARRLSSAGQPRYDPTDLSRQEFRDAVTSAAQALNLGNTNVTAAINQLSQRRRNLSTWGDIWAATNNRDLIRVCADIFTLEEGDATQQNQGGGGGGGRGGGGRGPGGGGGGRGPGGGGPGGPGGGGGRGPGGGGPGGGGPGGGGGGGRPGFPQLPPAASVEPSAWFGTGRQGVVQLMQGGGGGFPGGGGNQGGGGGRGGGNTGGGGRGGTTGGGTTGGGATDDTGSGTAEGDEEPIDGVININTAPAEVIAALPSMTPEVAQAIVEYRQSNPFASRGDILAVPQVTQQIFNAMIEHVTVFSDSFKVRVLGFSLGADVGRQRQRDTGVHLTATLDRSTGRTRIVRLRQDN